MASQESSQNPNPQCPNPTGNPFIGVHMKCCNTYVRAYLNATKDAYLGRCPRCVAQVQINIVEEGGSNSRFFEAS